MLATILTVINVVMSPIGRVLGFLSPVGSVLSVLYGLITSPAGKIVCYVLIAVGLYAAGDIHGHMKEHSFMVAQNKQETARAVAEANAARDAADKKFTDGRFNNRPGIVPGRVRHGSDGFARD